MPSERTCSLSERAIARPAGNRRVQPGWPRARHGNLTLAGVDVQVRGCYRAAPAGPRGPAIKITPFLQMSIYLPTIRSRQHKLGSYEINKVGLCCFDNKRYLMDDGITSYSYGHHRIGSL